MKGKFSFGCIYSHNPSNTLQRVTMQPKMASHHYKMSFTLLSYLNKSITGHVLYTVMCFCSGQADKEYKD